MTHIAIAGCTGRMGVALIHAATRHDAVSDVVGSIRSENLPDASSQLGMLGVNVDQITLTDKLEGLFDCDVVIDFTRPELTMRLVELAVEKKIPLVSGTTGLNDEQLQQLHDAANHTPIVWSANMSVGVNLLMSLVQQAAAALDLSYDIEVQEMHHKHKVDAPSGTALELGRYAAAGRQIDFDAYAVLSREGIPGEREEGTIGFATMRGGQVVGEHTVMFAGDHDRIELTHRSQSRDIYAEGAVKAALWVKSQSADGLYSMKDVLALPEAV